MSQTVRFGSRDGAVELEGQISGGGDRGVVICHPHPLFGGDMHNNVTAALFERLSEAGYRVLRFNFRGVGGSGGEYAGGRGEVGDVLGAVDFLREAGCEEIVVAGYSFGAAVVLNALSRSGAVRFVAVALPTEMGREYYEEIPVSVGVPSLVASGDRDEISSLEKVELIARFEVPPRRILLEGCDHFFSDLESLRKLCENVADFITGK